MNPYNSRMHRFALVFSVCLLVACSPSEAESVARPPQPSVKLPAAVLETAEVRDFAKIVDAHLRLRPDRRFLLGDEQDGDRLGRTAMRRSGVDVMPFVIENINVRVNVGVN